MNILYLCNKKKPCNGTSTCIDGVCKYTLDGDYVKNPESVAIAKAFERRFKMEVHNDHISFVEKEKEDE